MFESDKSEFNASPAAVGGQLFLRSDEYLDCVQTGANEGKKHNF